MSARMGTSVTTLSHMKSAESRVDRSTDKTEAPKKSGGEGEVSASSLVESSSSDSKRVMSGNQTRRKEKQGQEPPPELTNTNEAAEVSQKHEFLVLQTLARQLEYYFSQQNLSKDTYVQTLRSLNDGCVPVTILASFAKVKTILAGQEEEVRINAILQAAGEHSDLLLVHSIETETGKIATDATPSSAITILAVGTESGEALNNDRLHLPPSPMPSTNTIIVRDVAPTVTEAEVRALFDDVEGCPGIVSLYADVAYCWFVTLDTEDRGDMMRVLMQLRGMTLAGEYVMARLRASAVTSAPVDTYSTLPTVPDLTTKKKKKKKKRRRAKKKNAAGPPLTVDNFPTLHDEKVEWETKKPVDEVVEKDNGEDSEEDDDDDTLDGDRKTPPPEEDELGENEPKSIKTLSDVASTATTTSSSMESFKKQPPVMGCYAAALLKTPAPPMEATAAVPTSPKTAMSVVVPQETDKVVVEAKAREERAPVQITPPSWGGGRSFADILREKDEERQQRQ